MCIYYTDVSWTQNWKTLVEFGMQKNYWYMNWGANNCVNIFFIFHFMSMCHVNLFGIDNIKVFEYIYKIMKWLCLSLFFHHKSAVTSSNLIQHLNWIYWNQFNSIWQSLRKLNLTKLDSIEFSWVSLSEIKIEMN